MTPRKLWFWLFATWSLLLSGLLSGWIGSPGVLQAVRLSSLLDAKQDQIAKLEAEIERLETERARLHKSPLAQEREIRRVLGYAAQDEIIFDFSGSDTVGLVSLMGDRNSQP